jgi:transposase
MTLGVLREPCSVAWSTRVKPLLIPLSPGTHVIAGGRVPSAGHRGGVVVMDVVCQRCVGLDVDKRTVKVCVRVQGSGSRKTAVEVTTWSTSLPQLVRLRAKLVADGVQRVVMESTSDYWRPVFYVLSEQLDEVMLVKASDVKAIPGRKSDVSDAEWLADLGAHGLVRASFVPPQDQRQLRDLTRARARLLEDRTREVQRLEKDLEDACIKLSAVVTDLQGVSARLILDALVDHHDDPTVMADLAKGRLRSKIDQLSEALTGRVTDHHRFMLRFRLRRIDAATADLAELDGRVDQLIKQMGFHPARDLLLSVPGLGQRGAEELLAEIGTDMGVFATSAALVSWAGTAPGSHESAGKRKAVRARPGNRYVKRTLGIAAKSVARQKRGFLSARFRRLAVRRGYGRALVATEHAMLTAIWHMLRDDICYHDLGNDYYQQRRPEHILRRKINDLEAAGYTVTRAA